MILILMSDGFVEIQNVSTKPCKRLSLADVSTFEWFDWTLLTFCTAPILIIISVIIFFLYIFMHFYFTYPFRKPCCEKEESSESF